MKRTLFSKRFRDIFLILTEFCPNRCVYCYIKHRDRQNAMPMEYIDQLITSFEYEKPRIIFFGGEPLVELDLMEQVLAKYWNTCRFQVVTSATVNYEAFITDVYPKFPIPEIQLSWDGANNTNRPRVDGIDTQDHVLRTILWTLDKQVAIDVKCVINDDNVSSVADTYHTFKMLRKEYPGLLHGDFVVAHQKELQSDFADQLAVSLQQALQSIQEDLAQGITPYIPRDWMNKMLAVIINDHHISSCDAGNYIVMRPNGDLHPCTIFSQLDYKPFKIGNIANKEINFEVFDAIKTKCTHQDCQECEVNCLCDGGCRYERYMNIDGSFDHYYCKHQCNTIHVFYKVIKNWLSGLSANEKIRLMQYLQSYQKWSLEYSLPRGEKQC